MRWFALNGLIAALPLAASIAVVMAQENADVTRGLAYTRMHCSQCHADDARRKDQPLALRIATFEEIANVPGMTERALAVWFQSPHPRMPNLVLAPRDRDDVIAYIMSLKRQR